MRRAARGLQAKPTAVELVRREIIRHDVLELHGR
jgi:hypothetical protein